MYVGVVDLPYYWVMLAVTLNLPYVVCLACGESTYVCLAVVDLVCWRGLIYLCNLCWQWLNLPFMYVGRWLNLLMYVGSG